MLGQNLHGISSREARQKCLRKNIMKSNREEARRHAIEFILELIHDDGDMAQARFTCETVISNVAERVQRGTPEPDVDNFEQIFNGPPPSGNNSAGSSPSASPTQQVIQTPQRQGVIGTDILSPAHYRPVPDSDDSFI